MEGLHDCGEKVGYGGGGDDAEDVEHLFVSKQVWDGGWDGGVTRIHVLISVKASLAPWRNDCCSLSTQSSSPISSSRRQAASCFSSSESQLVVRGKLGRRKMAMKETKMVIAPSMMKSHRHARRPLAWSMLSVMPAAMRPENAPEIKEPEYSAAVRKPSSLRVYHALRKYRQPGWPGQHLSQE